MEKPREDLILPGFFFSYYPEMIELFIGSNCLNLVNKPPGSLAERKMLHPKCPPITMLDRTNRKEIQGEVRKCS